MGGRLTESNLTYNKKHQYIIPKESHLANLIIRDAHARTLHGGNQTTLSYIRRKFWVINAKNKIRFIIHKCPTCISHAAEITNTHPEKDGLVRTCKLQSNGKIIKRPIVKLVQLYAEDDVKPTPTSTKTHTITNSLIVKNSTTTAEMDRVTTPMITKVQRPAGQRYHSKLITAAFVLLTTYS